jgi:hypothetical protein
MVAPCFAGAVELRRPCCHAAMLSPCFLASSTTKRCLCLECSDDSSSRPASTPLAEPLLSSSYYVRIGHEAPCCPSIGCTV